MQSLRRAEEPPPVPPPAQLPAIRPDRPLQRTTNNPEQVPPPPPERPAAGPATRRRPPRARPPRSWRPSTNALVGGSLVASVALVVGLTLPLLSSGTPAEWTATPPASDHPGAAATPEGHGNPGNSLAPVGVPLADHPGAVAAVNPSAARSPVTLLANRTAAPSGVPVQLPAPAQLAPAAGPTPQVGSPVADQGPRHAGVGYPTPRPQTGPPAPSTPPDPQSEYEREQLARLAQLLAAQWSRGPGGPIPTSGPPATQYRPPAPKNSPPAPKGSTFSNGTPAANGGSSGYSSGFKSSGGAGGINSANANHPSGQATLSRSSSFGTGGSGVGTGRGGGSGMGGGSMGGSGGGAEHSSGGSRGGSSSK